MVLSQGIVFVRKQRRDAGMTPGLVRLSVGIEDVEDLWNDIVQALKISSQ
jgi:cystathionine beta-lyase/cystathionine gamma-synthase